MRIYRRRIFQVLTVVFLLATTAVSQDRYQNTQPNEMSPNAATDLIEQLHLTPEQRQKIRAIREQSKEMRSAIRQRLVESNLALEQALDADNLDETLIEQRLKEASTAQVASIRMRIQTELSIRRVLNPDQIATLRSLRQQARGLKRGANQNQGQNPQGAEELRQKQRNGIAPLFPQRNVTPRNPRP
jgi:Spy/CpxP family protein refolding chaperone